jgi:hypothetical protein
MSAEQKIINEIFNANKYEQPLAGAGSPSRPRGNELVLQL